MSQPLLPEYRVVEILGAAIAERDLQITCSFDRFNNEPFYIFETWQDVERLHGVAASMITPEEITEYVISDKDLENNHAIDWIIGGEWSFSDSYQTCNHCGAAIDIQDYYPLYWLDADLGDIFCADCVGKHYTEEYLVYCANHLSGDTQEIARHFIDPAAYAAMGFIRLNNNEDYDNSPYTDHFTVTDDSRIEYLKYAKYEDLARLDRARRIIDPDLQLVCAYGKYSTSYDFWARFDPDQTDEKWINNPSVLEYVLSLVFAKYLSIK